jgi:mannosyltransferase
VTEVMDRPASTAESGSWPALVATTATGLAALLVVIQLGDHSFWYDEAFSVGTVDRPFGDALWRIANWEVNQSPFYLLLLGWWQLGHTETFLRLLPAAAAVLAVPAMYVLGTRVANRRIGAVAALLLSCHPLVVQWGQQLRGYSLVLLLVISAGILLLRMVEEPSSARRAVAYAAVAGLATYAHFFAGLVVLAHGTWLLLGHLVTRRTLLVAGSAYAVSVLPLLAFFVGREGDPLYWLGERSTRSAVVEVGRDLAGGTRFGFVPYLLAVLAGAYFARRGGRRLAEPGALWPLAVLWLAFPVGLVLAVTVTVKPLLLGRFFIVVLPAVFLLAAAAFEGLGRAAGGVLLVALVVSSALGLQNWYSTPSHQDWRSAARLVAEEVGPDGDVVVEPGRGVFALRYYEQRLGLPPFDVLRPGPLDPPAGPTLVEVQILSDSGGPPVGDDLYAEWREANYAPVEDQRVEGLLVRTYRRR